MHVLILDYSLDAGSTPLFMRQVPDGARVTAHHVTVDGPLEGVLDTDSITHVLHSGSALCIAETVSFTESVCAFIRQCAAQRIWQMGVCYGHQLLCRALLGPEAVRASPKGFEAGWRAVTFDPDEHTPLPIAGEHRVWQHHFDEVTAVPEGSQVFATAAHSRIQGWISTTCSAMGTQFHPEFDADSGNAYFRRDVENLTAQGVSLDELLAGTPDRITGPELFEFFFTRGQAGPGGPDIS